MLLPTPVRLADALPPPWWWKAYWRLRGSRARLKMFLHELSDLSVHYEQRDRIQFTQAVGRFVAITRQGIRPTGKGWGPRAQTWLDEALASLSMNDTSACVVDILLQAGASPKVRHSPRHATHVDAHDTSVLTGALRAGRRDIAELLLDAGAQVAMDEPMDWRILIEASPGLPAKMEQSPDETRAHLAYLGQLLMRLCPPTPAVLDAVYDWDRHTSTEPALLWAARHHAIWVLPLLAAGASPQVRDGKGNTLWHALAFGYHEVSDTTLYDLAMEAAQALGVDPLVPNATGQQPIDILRSHEDAASQAARMGPWERLHDAASLREVLDATQSAMGRDPIAAPRRRRL